MSLFSKQLPKLELHAHLNGSIRRSTLRCLAQERGIDASGATVLERWPSTLSEAFSVFKVIHACVTTLQDVERITSELGEDLEADNVVYAEIRTTPRDMTLVDSANNTGWDRYVQAVLNGFNAYTRSSTKPIPTHLRLLLSIDRAKHNADDAYDVVRLAGKYRSLGVVGIDLSGDPTKGSFADFIPALNHARSIGLKITLHAGEVRNMDEEMTQMLAFAPDRFGHCCFVNESNMEDLKRSRIPIELCPTSNLLSNSVSSISEHHFGIHHTRASVSTICCISTDDSGVFGSPLSNEYHLIKNAFGLEDSEVTELARNVINAAFLNPKIEADERVLNALKEEFQAFEDKIGSES